MNLDVNPSDLHFIKTLKRTSKYTETFINNEFDDMYILTTDKTINEMRYQKEEISEIYFVPYKTFKQMVTNKQSDLLMHNDEFEILFNLLDEKYDK